MCIRDRPGDSVRAFQQLAFRGNLLAGKNDRDFIEERNENYRETLKKECFQ